MPGRRRRPDRSARPSPSPRSRARASRSRGSARAGRRPGLRPQHLAAVRAVALVCGARVGGAFDGSPDLRFEPGAVGGRRVPLRDRHRGRGQPGAADRPAAAGHGGGREPGGGARGARTCPRARPFTTWRVTGRRWSSAWACAWPRRWSRAGFYPRGGGELRARGPALVPAGRRARAGDAGRLVAVRGQSVPRPAEGRRGPAAARGGAGSPLGGAADRGRVEVGDDARGVRRAASSSRGRVRGGPGRVRLAGRARSAGGGVGRPCGADAPAVPRRRRGAPSTPTSPTSSWCRCACPEGADASTTSEVTAHLETVAQVATAFGFEVRRDRTAWGCPEASRWRGVDPPRPRG